MNTRLFIVLTGGPGGGKTTLIDELAHAPAWATHGRPWVGRFSALPEAIYGMRYLNISPHERLFQRVMVHLQMALEDGPSRALASEEGALSCVIVAASIHWAYSLDRGWPEDKFFVTAAVILQ